MRRFIAALAALSISCSGHLPEPTTPTAMGGRPVVLVIANIEGDVGEETRAELISQLTTLDEELGGTPFGTRGGTAPLRCWHSGDNATLFARCNAEAQALGAALHADAVLWGRVVSKDSGLFQLYWSLPDEAARTFHPAGSKRQQLSWADFAPLLGDVLLGRASRGRDVPPEDLRQFAARLAEKVDASPAMHGFSSRMRAELGMLHGDTLLALALQDARGKSSTQATSALFERARNAFRRALRDLGLGGSSALRAAAQSALARAATELARRTGDAADYREAIAAYEAAAKNTQRSTSPQAWIEARTAAANLELELGQQTSDAALVARAVTDHRRIANAAPAPARGDALNNLCAATTTLGGVKRDASELEKAVQTCADASGAIDRNRTPLVWAAAKRNLGNALQALATFSSSDASESALERAITAYYDAQGVYAQHKAHDRWADVSMALGTAQAALGARNDNPDLLKAALDAFGDAQSVYTRESNHDTWVMLESNRAETLYTLGKLQGNPDALRGAAQALEAVADATPRRQAPAEWARVEHNLGTVLGTLGESTGDAEVLKRSVAALRAALEVRTKKAAPDDWAASELALGQYAHSLGHITGDLEAEAEAETALRSALNAYAEDPKSTAWAKARLGLASSMLALAVGRPESAGNRLEEAATIARQTANATRTTLPQASADASMLLGNVLEAQAPGARPRDRAALLCDALGAYLTAWSAAVDHAPTAAAAAAERIQPLLERTRSGRACRSLPKDALTRYRHATEKSR